MGVKGVGERENKNFSNTTRLDERPRQANGTETKEDTTQCTGRMAFTDVNTKLPDARNYGTYSTGRLERRHDVRFELRSPRLVVVAAQED